MGMSGSQTETVQLLEGRLIARLPISCAGRAPGKARDRQSGKPILREHNEDRGLADMLLDSVCVPRMLPPQLSALVALLRSAAAQSAARQRRDN
jgi:hypothetical protein